MLAQNRLIGLLKLRDSEMDFTVLIETKKTSTDKKGELIWII